MRVFLATSLCALLLGCGSRGAPVMLITQNDEIAIGREVAAEVSKEYGQPVRSGAEHQRVQLVAGRLLPLAARQVPYSVSLLDNNSEVNAFAAPGGPLFVTRALVNTMTDDDELAFVVGHEMAHVELEHGRQAVNQAVLLGSVAAAVLDNRSELLQLGAGVVWTLYRQGYSRDHERAADSTGLRFAVRAGYPPQGALRALAKLGGGEQRGPAKWLASHPSTPERIRRLEALIQSEYVR
ncbi:MAG: M48 family metalloprotease [Fimbriimonadaceae bacterium]|nr:M48 family metalloprotease [Fimbriimonadaceae bacterium]